MFSYLAKILYIIVFQDSYNDFYVYTGMYK